jgi:predicted Zn-dependent protease
MSRLGRPISVVVTVGVLASGAACTINPVTGERELAIVSAEDEVAIGIQQYFPSQQMQGGEYLRDPALTRYVQGVGNRLGDVSDRALPYEFVVLNHSTPNAWALPGGKIAINRGLLLELNSEAELAAVLGHEIVHAAARHGAQSMQRGILLQSAVLIAAMGTRDDDYSELVVGAAGLGAQLINMRHGREAELEADAYGMQYLSRAGYDPRAAIDLQETFVRLSGGRDGGGRFAGLFASHPPSAERVAQNRATAATLPATGTLGGEAYMSATANLRRDAPGYASLDAAAAALGEGDLALARREAEAALARIPDEAQVHGLIGDIEMADGRPAQALSRYEQALARNGRFFRFHAGKGDAHLALDQIAQAESAYQASIGLLPTAGAYLGLGRIAEARGNVALALEHYGRAAEAPGRTGTEARTAGIRLDLPQNPERYLAVATGLDANGRLLVEIRNRTEIEVAGIELTVSYVDGGQARLVRRALEGTLAAGGAQRFATGLGPFASSADYAVAVEAARVAQTR